MAGTMPEMFGGIQGAMYAQDQQLNQQNTLSEIMLRGMETKQRSLQIQNLQQEMQVAQQRQIRENKMQEILQQAGGEFKDKNGEVTDSQKLADLMDYQATKLARAGFVVEADKVYASSSQTLERLAKSREQAALAAQKEFDLKKANMMETARMLSQVRNQADFDALKRTMPPEIAKKLEGRAYTPELVRGMQMIMDSDIKQQELKLKQAIETGRERDRVAARSLQQQRVDIAQKSYELQQKRQEEGANKGGGKPASAPTKNDRTLASEYIQQLYKEKDIDLTPGDTQAAANALAQKALLIRQSTPGLPYEASMQRAADKMIDLQQLVESKTSKNKVEFHQGLGESYSKAAPLPTNPKDMKDGVYYKVLVNGKEVVGVKKGDKLYPLTAEQARAVEDKRAAMMAKRRRGAPASAPDPEIDDGEEDDPGEN